MTEDAIEPIWQRYGVLGLARLLADIAIRVPIEQLAQLRRDVRYGLRMLARSPGFTFVALVSLSLGIAIATCAYSEVNGLILRDIPGVPKPGELVALDAPTSYPNYKRYRERSDPSEFGDSWSRHRTSALWMSTRPWAGSSIRKRSNPATPRQSRSATGSGSGSWAPTLRPSERSCASTGSTAR
jgi:hypothetical protein